MDVSRSALYFADVHNCRARKVDFTTGIIATIAGGGSADPGDGQLATAATLSTHPMRLALDQHGHIYLSDAHQNRIRKIDATSHIITTAAGNGEGKCSGDESAATTASLFSPHAARVDQRGDLYIADTGNNRIRRVDTTTGLITTVAGNGNDAFSGDGEPATAAALSGPLALAVDHKQHLYIADRGNNRIRRVDTTTGLIATIAGTGAAGPMANGIHASETSFATLRDLCFGPDGQLYIADGDSHCIGRLDLDTGIISIVAGTGQSGYCGDGGPATDALLNHPYSIAFDPDRNLYIFDTLNSRIRKVDAITGFISTITGTGQPGYSGDGGPATDAAIGCGG